jgi:hypothetical protein
MTRPLQVAVLVLGLLVAAGAAVASGAVSFSEPPRAAVVAAQPAPEPTPTIDLVAANAQMMTDCNCGK